MRTIKHDGYRYHSVASLVESADLTPFQATGQLRLDASFLIQQPRAHASRRLVRTTNYAKRAKMIKNHSGQLSVPLSYRGRGAGNGAQHGASEMICPRRSKRSAGFKMATFSRAIASLLAPEMSTCSSSTLVMMVTLPSMTLVESNRPPMPTSTTTHSNPAPLNKTKAAAVNTSNQVATAPGEPASFPAS
jgi:hypothetical protein